VAETTRRPFPMVCAVARMDDVATDVDLPRSRDARWWVVGAVALGAVAAGLRSLPFRSDAFFNLSSGRFIAQHGLPHENVATVASGHAEWIDQQWLAHLAFFRAWELGGYPLAAVLSIALIAAAFGVLALTMCRNGCAPAAAFRWSAMGVIGAIPSMTVRAQSFAVLLFALLVLLIFEDQRRDAGGRALWLCVPLLLVWGNTHGSALLGAGLLVLYACASGASALQRGRATESVRYFGVALTGVVASMATPYGTRIVAYYRDVMGNDEIAKSVTEWAPPRLDQAVSWPFFAILVIVLAAFGGAALQGRRPPLRLAVIGLALVILAFTGVRFEVWFTSYAVVLVAVTAANPDRSSTLLPAFRSATVAVVVVLALLVGIRTMTQGAERFEASVPRAALEHVSLLMADDPDARLIGDEESQTAMLWFDERSWGRVAFDVRFEQYRAEELALLTDLVGVRGARWMDVLDGYDIVVVSRRERPTLTRAMHTLDGWAKAFDDGEGVVFTRKGATDRWAHP
jgi:hypothetical protein